MNGERNVVSPYAINFRDDLPKSRIDMKPVSSGLMECHCNSVRRWHKGLWTVASGSHEPAFLIDRADRVFGESPKDMRDAAREVRALPAAPVEGGGCDDAWHGKEQRHVRHAHRLAPREPPCPQKSAAVFL